MYAFTAAQQQKRTLLAGAFPYPHHRRQQLSGAVPFQIFGIHTTWGAFSFPFIFLATDLTVRIFGSHLARRIIFG